MSPPAAAQQRNSFVSNLAASAFSASFAEACTIPIDTAKVRLQLQASATGPPKYKGMMGTMMTVAREEGVGALFKGAGANALRTVGSALVLVMYGELKGILAGAAGK